MLVSGSQGKYGIADFSMFSIDVANKRLVGADRLSVSVSGVCRYTRQANHAYKLKDCFKSATTGYSTFTHALATDGVNLSRPMFGSFMAYDKTATAGYLAIWYMLYASTIIYGLSLLMSISSQRYAGTRMAIKRAADLLNLAVCIIMTVVSKKIVQKLNENGAHLILVATCSNRALRVAWGMFVGLCVLNTTVTMLNRSRLCQKHLHVDSVSKYA